MTTAPRIDLVTQLLRFALDPAASEGEATNAAAKMVTVARRERVQFEHLQTALVPAPKREKPERPAACSVTLNFGKYTGATLAEVAQNDIEYLRWIIENVSRKPEIVEAAEVVLDYFTGGGR
jgi:hypothetical protein